MSEYEDHIIDEGDIPDGNSEDDGSVCSGDFMGESLRYEECPLHNGVLAPGIGRFAFMNPATLKDIVVYYIKSENYVTEDPVVMVFHGVYRNPDVYRDRWIELALEHGLFVIAPLFSEDQFPGTEGYNLGNIFEHEKPKPDSTLKDERSWSYHIPGVVFDYLREKQDTVSMGYLGFGHSAGSQFLHRKIALAPDPRLLLAIAANAGWYTMPTFDEKWPYGLTNSGLTEDALGLLFGANLIVLLGDDDINPKHKNLRRTKEANAQGRNRFERGKTFFRVGQEMATRYGLTFNWRIEFVEGVGHDSEAMSPSAARLMSNFIQTVYKSNWGRDESADLSPVS